MTTPPIHILLTVALLVAAPAPDRLKSQITKARPT